MNIEHVEAAAMHRDIDRAEQWVAERYSDDDTRPTRAETDAFLGASRSGLISD